MVDSSGDVGNLPTAQPVSTIVDTPAGPVWAAADWCESCERGRDPLVDADIDDAGCLLVMHERRVGAVEVVDERPAGVLVLPAGIDPSPAQVGVDLFREDRVRFGRAAQVGAVQLALWTGDDRVRIVLDGDAPERLAALILEAARRGRAIGAAAGVHGPESEAAR